LTAVGGGAIVGSVTVDRLLNGGPVRGPVPLRVSAGAMMLGAMGWLVAVPVLAGRPSGPIADHVHATLIPAVMVALLIGSVGLKAWLEGFRPRARRRTGPGGFASGLEAMSSQRHRAVGGAGSGDDEDTLTARGLGVGSLRLGAVGVIVSSLLVAGGPAMRPTLLASWVVFFAGTMILGLAVVTAPDLPHRAGGLLVIGSLLVFSSITIYLAGGARRSAFVGPLLGADERTPVLAVLLWSILGAGWAWLGGALWLRTRRADEAAGPVP
jgi:hypothetical protein